MSVKVMTFETTRMRTVSAELRTSILQRMRAMPTGIRTVGVTQSPTAANARLKRLMVRGCECKSNVDHARMSIVDIYPVSMASATGLK